MVAASLLGWVTRTSAVIDVSAMEREKRERERVRRKGGLVSGGSQGNIPSNETRRNALIFALLCIKASYR